MTPRLPNLTSYPAADDLVRGAAEIFVDLAATAVAARGRFTVALAGGGTPRPVYALLATREFAGRVDWGKVHVCFGDERCVPPTDQRSNFRMAREALLDQVPLPADNIHRIAGEDDPADAALAYMQDLQRLFRGDALPAFDLIWLGLGDNGHTASLFPGTASLREEDRWVVAQYVEVLTAWRVTLTPAAINAARDVVFLVAGAGKAEVLARVLTGPHEPDVLPAQLIKPGQGRLHWLVDAAAGAALPAE
jgi:6-phosphogluconolactonase